MTAPVEPTPVAPVAPPVPTAPAPVVPEAPPTAPTAPATAFDPGSLSPEAQEWVKGQLAAADLKARTTSKQNAANEARQAMAAQVAKALGITPPEDQPLTPEQLEVHLEQARDQAWARGLEVQMLRLAGGHAETLLDRVSFVDSLDDLTDMDPGSAEFQAALKERVDAAVAKLPAGTQSTGPRPDPSQGARGASAPDRQAQITAAQKAGNWREVIRLQNQTLSGLMTQQQQHQ